MSRSEFADIGQIDRVHLIGIGGAGLSAIATVLLERGYRVSGTDLRPSGNTQRLLEEGADVTIGHSARHLGSAQMVIVSSAIPADNEELRAARQRGLPVLKRDEVFSRLTVGRKSIAVAGTHGKTTTAAMIAWMLLQAGCDPSFIVGGTMEGLGTNARAGRGPHFVVEADEYDNAFLGLAPSVAVILHLEPDHPDCFPDLAAMSEAFFAFLQRVESGGVIIGCGDADNVVALLDRVRDVGTRRVLTYGLADGCDWVARDLKPDGQGGVGFDAWCGATRVGRVGLRLPGVHNVQNALGALAAVTQAGVAFEPAREALSTFRGTERRFQIKGTAEGVTVIDDYAHHPTQVRATLAAARERFGSRTLWAVFQPHTYSRTRMLLQEFATSFDDADHVIVTDIYAARESDDLGVSAADMVSRMAHPDARHIPGLDDAASYLLANLSAGHVLAVLGAGDVTLIGEKVLAALESGRDGQRRA